MCDAMVSNPGVPPSVWRSIVAIPRASRKIVSICHRATTTYTRISPSALPKYRGADKSLPRPGKKQARKHVRDARHSNIETRAVINDFFLLQGKAPKEIHAILTETLACFLPVRAKDLSAHLYS